MPEHTIGTREEWAGGPRGAGKARGRAGRAEWGDQEEAAGDSLGPRGEGVRVDTDDGKKALAELFDGLRVAGHRASLCARIQLNPR
jgi:hypothetical protein